MARLLAFNPKTGEFTEFEQKTLQDFYDHLECECFDVAYRSVGAKEKCFDIFVDDIGLFREEPIPSAIDKSFKPQLVGNLVFANHDNKGNTTSLSNEEIEYIKSCIIPLININIEKSKKWFAIFPVDYPRR